VKKRLVFVPAPMAICTGLGVMTKRGNARRIQDEPPRNAAVLARLLRHRGSTATATATVVTADAITSTSAAVESAAAKAPRPW